MITAVFYIFYMALVKLVSDGFFKICLYNMGHKHSVYHFMRFYKTLTFSWFNLKVQESPNNMVLDLQK